MTIVLRSKKFVLRQLRLSDAAAITRHIRNRKIFRNTLHIPYPYRLSDAQNWLRRTVPMYRKSLPGEFNLGIVVNNEVVGGIGLKHIEHGHKAEIGYWLGEQYWGQGIMSQAAALITTYGFKRFKLKRIYAYVFLHNSASRAVLTKNGFRTEGILRKNVRKGTKLLDEYVLAKIKT